MLGNLFCLNLFCLALYLRLSVCLFSYSIDWLFMFSYCVIVICCFCHVFLVTD